MAALASAGLVKLSGQLLETLPGDEARALTLLAAGGTPPPAPPAHGGPTRPPVPPGWQEASQALDGPGAVILAGERLADMPGALAATSTRPSRS